MSLVYMLKRHLSRLYRGFLLGRWDLPPLHSEACHKRRAGSTHSQQKRRGNRRIIRIPDLPNSGTGTAPATSAPPAATTLGTSTPRIRSRFFTNEVWKMFCAIATPTVPPRDWKKTIRALPTGISVAPKTTWTAKKGTCTPAPYPIPARTW